MKRVNRVVLWLDPLNPVCKMVFLYPVSFLLIAAAEHLFLLHDLPARVCTGRGGTRRLDQLAPSPPLEPIANITGSPLRHRLTKATGNKQKESTDIPPTEGADSATGGKHSRPFVSVVESPFGPLALSVHDPSSYCPKFPVFADDAGEQDLQLLLEQGLEMLDTVQVSVT